MKHFQRDNGYRHHACGARFLVLGCRGGDGFPVAWSYPIDRYRWIRDPRDCIIGPHNTDDLRDFGVEYPDTDDVRKRRAISWYYQYQIMKATPEPENLITVRFEDFVENQEETLEQLEVFLGIPLARIVVRRDPVGRWKTDRGQHYFSFFEAAMAEQGYEVI